MARALRHLQGEGALPLLRLRLPGCVRPSVSYNSPNLFFCSQDSPPVTSTPTLLPSATLSPRDTRSSLLSPSRRTWVSTASVLVLSRWLRRVRRSVPRLILRSRCAWCPSFPSSVDSFARSQLRTRNRTVLRKACADLFSRAVSFVPCTPTLPSTVLASLEPSSPTPSLTLSGTFSLSSSLPLPSSTS